MSAYDLLQQNLREKPAVWLVTGAAGFIGSHLIQKLLELDQRVIGLDNLSSGKASNLEHVRSLVKPGQWAQFTAIEGDIRNPADCSRACEGVTYVLHQAALGSVPRSVEDPFRSHDSNVTGCLNMLIAARDQAVRRFVYASSSSVYGDHPALPKIEENIGASLSPYAATKLVDEIYAETFARCYGLEVVGLRYFNVFGPRQDPEGAYAAVIPKWFAALASGQNVLINGDGQTSRDFCYVANVVQANLLAASVQRPDAINRAYNVACGERTSLVQLFDQVQVEVAQTKREAANRRPVFGPERKGDVRHSQASIEAAEKLLGYRPTHTLAEGLRLAASWYLGCSKSA